MTACARNKTPAERLALLQDKLRRHIMAGEDDLDELKFEIEQARVDVELAKTKEQT